MTTQPDLLQYPYAPGYKREGTSAIAAAEMEHPAETLREQVHTTLMLENLTADEVAAKLGRSVLAIRPRLSELVKQGSIHDTTTRRRNASGKSAVVWRANHA